MKKLKGIKAKWFVISNKLNSKGEIENQYFENTFETEQEAKDFATSSFAALAIFDQKRTSYEVFRAKEWASVRQKELGLSDTEDEIIDAVYQGYTPVLTVDFDMCYGSLLGDRRVFRRYGCKF
ncbi:MAG: hypothetical protein WCX20_01640 [Candidatus Shapirobacteria bacterium]